MNEVKQGLKSSEFWAMLGGVGVIVWQFAQANCSVDQTKLFGLVVLVGAYIAGRSYVKGKTAAQTQTITPVTKTVSK